MGSEYLGDPLTRERPDGPHQEYLRAANDHESMGKGDTSTVIYLRVKLLVHLSQNKYECESYVVWASSVKTQLKLLVKSTRH